MNTMDQNDSSKFTEALTAAPVLGIIRADSVDSGVRSVRELADGGLRVIEISLSSRDALVAFDQARSELSPAVCLGVGTVRKARDATDAIAAGAQFLVSPNYSAAVVAHARDAGLPIACGVITPTEIQVAVDDGVDWLKIFPAGAFGPSYVRALREPFPELRFIPSGGVSIDDLVAYRVAGAAAVALGGALTGFLGRGATTASAARSALDKWRGVSEG